MGGGNYPNRAKSNFRQGLSPRGRGKRYVIIGYSMALGSIPAWAGETAFPARISKRPSVYPRVGGGNRYGNRTPFTAIGLSPRGRGKRALGGGLDIKRRSIPAWAGETTRASLLRSSSAVYPRVGGGNGVSSTRIHLA